MTIAFLSGNALKIIAMLSMTIDHIGLILLDNNPIFRIIGRIAFPIFAYMIAEGCSYTKDRRKYFLRVFALGVLCQAGYFLISRSLHLNILLTFSASILIIYLKNLLYDEKEKGHLFLLFVIMLWAFTKVLGIVYIKFDYGFWGIMLPVIISLSDKKPEKILLTAFGLLMLYLSMGGLQVFSFLSLIPLMLYSGKRGRTNLKYAFYIFYPLHLLILHSISILM